MKLTAFDIPDQPEQLGVWLERRLVSDDLGALVAELLAVRGKEPVAATALHDAIPATELQRILSDGMQGVPYDLLQTLLKEPMLLLELQTRILDQGGVFWDSVERPVGMRQRLERGRVAFEAYVRDPMSRFQRPGRQVIKLEIPWYRRPWFASAVTAAGMVILGLVFLRPEKRQEAQVEPPKQPAVATVAWGWNKPGVIDQTGSPKDYLNNLAAAAEHWSDVHPHDAKELAHRLNEMRQGCSRLILANHPALPNEDRAWLVARCRSWAASLDGALAGLESGADYKDVQRSADETVEKLIKALRERATLV